MGNIRKRKIRREVVQVACTGLGAYFAQSRDPKNTIYGAIIGGGLGAIISEYLIPSEQDKQEDEGTTDNRQDIGFPTWGA